MAAVLVLVFSGPLIAPVFTGSVDESALPACCRRNGKHHCMMYRMMMGEVPSKYQTVTEKCPYSPFSHLSLLLFHAYLRHEHPVVTTQAATLTALVRQTEAGYRISFHRSRQKRGPPETIAL